MKILGSKCKFIFSFLFINFYLYFCCYKEIFWIVWFSFFFPWCNVFNYLQSQIHFSSWTNILWYYSGKWYVLYCCTNINKSHAKNEHLNEHLYHSLFRISKFFLTIKSSFCTALIMNHQKSIYLICFQCIWSIYVQHPSPVFCKITLFSLMGVKLECVFFLSFQTIYCFDIVM